LPPSAQLLPAPEALRHSSARLASRSGAPWQWRRQPQLERWSEQQWDDFVMDTHDDRLLKPPTFSSRRTSFLLQETT
jgi:GT2 family glycosyltransferase